MNMVNADRIDTPESVRGAAPLLPQGGTVRLHPDLIGDGGLTARLALRRRLRAFNLRLLVTKKANPYGVELRL